jgi:hypothetical protein
MDERDLMFFAAEKQERAGNAMTKTHQRSASSFWRALFCGERKRSWVQGGAVRSSADGQQQILELPVCYRCSGNVGYQTYEYSRLGDEFVTSYSVVTVHNNDTAAMDHNRENYGALFKHISEGIKHIVCSISFPHAYLWAK